MAAGFMAGLGDTATNLIIQIGFALIAVVVLGILFYASRYGFGVYKKRKSFRISALIVNPDGTWYIQQIGKFKGKDNIDKMEFLGSTDTCPVIPLQYIRANKVILWRYAPGQFAIIPPSVWQKMRPEDFKIDVINLQMKNFAFLEQRAAVSRWAYMKDVLTKYAPYIAILLILIFGGVAIWIIMKTALGMFNDVTAQRVLECSKLLGISGGSAPA